MESSVIRQIHRLRQMTVGDLRLEWMKLYGESTRSRNRDYLWKRLAWRVQELANGGLSDDARKRINDLDAEGFIRARTPTQAVAALDPQPSPRPRRDQRLPTSGTVLVRQYRGRELRLVVHDDHFELNGQSFRSLSEAACHVTGSRWNGRLFWGLSQRKRKA